MDSSPALELTLRGSTADSTSAEGPPHAGPAADQGVQALRPVTIAFLAALGALTLGLGWYLLLVLTPLNQTGHIRGSLSLTMVGFLIVAWLFPLPFAAQSKLYLDTSVIVASVMLFEPGVAMFIAALGTATAHFLRRRSFGESFFNTSQAALQAAVGGLILMLSGWSSEAFRLDGLRSFLAIVGASVAIYAINTCLLAAVISLQTANRFTRTWAESAADTSPAAILAHLAQLAVGIVGAIAAAAISWAVVLLVLPAITVYTLTSRHLQRQKTDADP